MPVQSTVWESTSPLIPTSVPDTVQNSLPILSQPNLPPYIESGTLTLETLHLSTSRLKDEEIISENIPDIQASPTLSLTMVPDVPDPDIIQSGSRSSPYSNNLDPTGPMEEREACRFERSSPGSNLGYSGVPSGMTDSDTQPAPHLFLFDHYKQWLGAICMTAGEAGSSTAQLLVYTRALAVDSLGLLTLWNCQTLWI